MKLIEPKNYLPPTYDRIDELCKEKKIKLDKSGKDFVIDMASKYTGGNFYEDNFIENQIKEEISNLISNSAYDFDQRKAFSEEKEKELYDKKNLCKEILTELNLDDIKGKSPIDRAINFTFILNKLGMNKEAFKRASSFLNVKNLEQESKDLFNIDSNNIGEIPENFFDNKLDIICSISAQLDLNIPFQGLYSFKKDPEGPYIKDRKMKSLGELKKIKKKNWALLKFQKDLFWLKVVQKDFNIRERQIRETKKQLIFVLIDESGSMQDGIRFQKALGVLLNRIKAVKKNEAEVYFAFFDDSMGDIHEILEEKDCEKAIKYISKIPSGGGTRTHIAINAAVTYINELKRKDLYKPEILVVTDDDCSISKVIRKDLNNIRIHGISVAHENISLAKLSKETNGIYLQI